MICKRILINYGFKLTLSMCRNLLILFSIVFLSCTDSVPTEAAVANVSGAGTPLQVINVLHKDTAPFNLEFSLDQINSTSTTLITTLSLASGDYVTSPSSIQDFLGKYTLEFKDDTKMAIVGALIESPLAVDLIFSWDDSPVKCYVDTTTLSQSLRFLTDGDFNALGTVCFVLEPECYPYETSFVISREMGNLSVQRLSIEIPEF